MSDVLEYLRSYHPVREFERCEPPAALDVVYPISNDDEDERLMNLVKRNILRLYHRPYRAGSMPHAWPPEIMEEIEDKTGGGEYGHEVL